jgi:iron complex outermembrane recepter protein
MTSRDKVAKTLLTSALLLAVHGIAFAREKDRTLELVQVTATRAEEPVDRVPAAIAVISGEDLRARGARDLTQALQFVAGVEISQGGDNGPAGSVPAFMGLREFDAFLLVVDNVPYGGAFNPQLTTLDLNNVERIEVMRGAAPVTFGTTSFVGVIHVIHYAAGQSPSTVSAGLGSEGSGYVQGAYNLSESSTLSFQGERRGLADDDAGFDKLLALYRQGFAVGSGTFELDVALSRVAQDLNSPVVREGARLTNKTPLDANHNPSGAEIVEQRLQANLRYLTDTSFGKLAATASLARTTANLKRGFLTGLGNTPTTPNATGYLQDRSITDYYLDAHVDNPLGERGIWTFGADLIGGKANQENSLFDYFAPLNGQNRATIGVSQIIDRNESDNDRSFLGLYAQADWAISEQFDILAGVRLNRTHESKDGEDDSVTPARSASDTRNTTRATGHVGASFRAYENDADSVTVYADYRNSFKPAANDFGPEADADILETEDAKVIELGVKQRWFNGALDVDLSAYRLDFNNLVVPQNVDGRPGLANAGKLNLDGYEAEAQWHPIDSVSVFAAWAYHKAIFGDYQRLFGTTLTQLRGKNQELAPRNTRSLGIQFGADTGLQASVGYSYVGERFLNKRNTAPVGDYDTFGASLGWNFENWSVQFVGSNLTDKRPAIAESEIGDAQYYLLPSRHVEAGFSYRF